MNKNLAKIGPTAALFAALSTATVQAENESPEQQTSSCTFRLKSIDIALSSPSEKTPQIDYSAALEKINKGQQTQPVYTGLKIKTKGMGSYQQECQFSTLSAAFEGNSHSITGVLQEIGTPEINEIAISFHSESTKIADVTCTQSTPVSNVICDLTPPGQ